MATPSSQQPPLPPGLKYFRSAVEELLLGSVYLDTIVTSRPGVKNVALPLPGSTNPSDITGLQIFGQAQPLSIKTTFGNGTLRGTAAVRSSQSSISLRWVITPGDEFVLPFKQPPPTLFDARRSQRFTMMDIDFRLDEDGNNTFQGFGAGRTYPAVVAGEAQVWLGACGKIMRGTGVFENVQASFVLNGRMTPPDGLTIELLIRILASASGRLVTGPSLQGAPAASLGASNPLAGSTYLTFLGAPDPTSPISQDKAGGTITGASVTELLRPVRVEYSLDNDGRPLRAHYAAEDWIAGRLTTRIRFNLDPSDPTAQGTPLSPLPWYTEGTTITFFDPKGKEIGTITANIDEGRGFSTRFAGFPGPVLNLVGFGPFAGGTGSFADTQGMLSVNAGVCVDPPTLSNLYVLRLAPATAGSKARGGRHDR